VSRLPVVLATSGTAFNLADKKAICAVSLVDHWMSEAELSLTGRM